MIWFIIGIAVIGVTIFFIFLKKSQDEIEANFQRRFTGKNIRKMDKYALYVAKKSDGYSHFRAVGYLVLTEEELFFQRRLDTKITIIPIDAIIKVDRTRRLAGQSRLKLMLKVEFKTPEGAEDAIAWQVKELDEWVQQINQTVKDRSRLTSRGGYGR